MHLTRHRRIVRACALLGAAVGIGAALGAAHGRADGSPHRSGSRSGPACPAAGRTALTVPDGIDGFRVVVASAGPGSATDVTILADGRDRTLRAFAPGVIGLLLDEPLPARQVEVAVEPVLDAPVGACVARVELLRGGVVVGAAEIR
jgi:hypothetical protein